MAEGNSISQVKIYGERNTGTHFLHELVKKNFVVEMMASTGQGSEKRSAFADIRARTNEWLITTIVKDRYETITHKKLIEEGFGWKHTNVPTDYLKTQPERTAQTLFLVLVKHPVYWALSYKKRPYHTFFRYKDMEFPEFVRHAFIPCGRDNVDVPLYDSVIEMYADKIDGYRRLADMGLACELIRYEELLGDAEGFVERLEEKYGLERRRKKVIVKMEGAKGDETTLADYQEKYRVDRVRNAVSPEDYDYIIAKFGRDRLRWLGYPDA